MTIETTKLEMKGPTEGELYRLAGGAGWCQHGLVIIREVGAEGKKRLVAVDTYWGGQPSTDMVRNWHELPDVSGRLTFLLDLNTARITHEEEYEVFADEDRAWIPSGGSSQKWFIRNGARPVFLRQANRLHRLIEDAESKSAYHLKEARWRKDELNALYRAHTFRAGETMERCRPDCSTCAEVILVKKATKKEAA